MISNVSWRMPTTFAGIALRTISCVRLLLALPTSRVDSGPEETP